MPHMRNFLSDPRTSLAVLLLLCLGHILATWGHIGTFWGDAGVWLHEVDRFARGEVPYRDFTWPYPPLAIWLLGGVARVFGAQTYVVWTVTSVIFVLIFVAFHRYAVALLPPTALLPLVAGSFLLATGYANFQSAPLPTGMYTPAAPLGFLFLLTALVAFFQVLKKPGRMTAVSVGVLCAASFLTKHDFWIPALYLAVAGGVILFRQGEPIGRRAAWMLWASTIVVMALTCLILASQAGWSVLSGIFGGSGQISAIGGRSFPSWERITIEFTALATLALAACALLLSGGVIRFQETRRWFALWLALALLGCLVHVGMSLWIGLEVRAVGVRPFPGATEGFVSSSVQSNLQLLIRSLAWLKRRFLLHLFPIFLPAVLAGFLLVHWKRLPASAERGMALFLLGLCVAARSRRLVEHVDWYYFLLDLPVCFLVASLFFPDIKDRPLRRLGPALAFVGVLGIYSYWTQGVGFMTAAGQMVEVHTPHGRAFLRPDVAREYREIRSALDALDPRGTRPLFAFGPAGGYCYFLGRENPTPLTVGFRLSSFSSDAIVARLRSLDPPVLLLDNSYFDRLGSPSGELSFRYWDIQMVQNYFVGFDRPFFVAARAGCAVVKEIASERSYRFTLYDCAGPARP